MPKGYPLPPETRLEARRASKRAYMQRQRLNNPEKVRAYKKKQYDLHKETNSKKAKAYYQKNKTTRKAASRKDYAANTSARRAVAQAWRKAHRFLMNQYQKKYLALKRGAEINDLTPEQWETIKAHYGSRCAYCGRKTQRLEMDHITPVSQGGNHTKHNIVPACRSCNAKKHIGPPLKPVQPLLL